MTQAISIALSACLFAFLLWWVRRDERRRVKRELYERVREWQLQFYRYAAANAGGTVWPYYDDAASGLAIALQEIDRKQYDKFSAADWQYYQDLLKKHGVRRR